MSPNSQFSDKYEIEGTLGISIDKDINISVDSTDPVAPKISIKLDKPEISIKPENDLTISMIKSDEYTKKEWLTNVIMPIVIVVLTAILGTGVGVWLQNRSFKYNEVFKAKLDRIMANQKEATDILVEAEIAYRQIRRIESSFERGDQAQKNSYRIQGYRGSTDVNLDTLKKSKIRLDALQDSTQTFSKNSSVSEEIKKYEAGLSSFIQCVNNNILNGFSKNCANEHDEKVLGSLKSVVIAYSKMADEFIKEYE